MTVTAEPSHALGDARTGKMPGNVLGFCRALRRAGLTLDSARIALSIKALDAVGLQNRGDVAAAMESVLVHRGQDRFIFRELFDAYFRDPKMANQLLAQMLPTAQGQSAPDNRRARVREALNPPKIAPKDSPPQSETPIELDAAMTASEANRLRYADFNTLTASEYQLISQLVQDIPLPLPEWRSRRLQASTAWFALGLGQVTEAECAGLWRPAQIASASPQGYATAVAHICGCVRVNGALRAPVIGFSACGDPGEARWARHARSACFCLWDPTDASHPSL